MKRNIFITLLALLIAIGLPELFLRLQNYNNSQIHINSLEQLLQEANTGSPTTIREKENRFIIHNLALFQKNKELIGPAPQVIFIGSSRTKKLSPHHFFQLSSLVAGSNSYNEMTWAPLVEAEVLRRLYPNTKTFWFEASFLQRRPNQFFVEDDHKKYFFVLRDLINESGELKNKVNHVENLSSQSLGSFLFSKKLVLFEKRRDLKLFEFLKPTKKALSYSEVSEMPSLSPFGEIIAFDTSHGAEIQSVKKDNAKVVRIARNQEFIPGNFLYEAIVDWGKRHGIKVGFYIPPVHRKFYELKQELGLSKHLAHLEDLSQKNNVPVLDFLQPSLGWTDALELFSDEDHMGTCEGAFLLSNALVDATQLNESKAKPISTYKDSEKLKMACKK